MVEIHNTSKDTNVITMEMKEKQDVLCTAQAVLENGVATVTTLADELPMLRYDMGKALLNAIDLAGIQEVHCTNVEIEPVLKRLGFSLEDGVYKLCLCGYFTGHCDQGEC